MLLAWIVSPEESLYFAAPATPCNWASLRRHIRKMQRHRQGRLRVALRFDGSGVGAGSVEVAALLHELAAAGVDVTLATAVESSESFTPPIAVDESSPRGGVLGRKWGSSGHAANHAPTEPRGRGAIAPL